MRSRALSASTVRQRDELRLAWDEAEAAGFPIGFRFLDALGAGGDEVPPDVARAFHGGSADEHEARAALGSHADAVAGVEDEEAAFLENVAGDLDLALGHIDGALLMVGVERDAGAGRELDLGI